MLAVYKSNISNLTQAIARGLLQLESVTANDVEAANSVLAELNADLQFAKAEVIKFKLYTNKRQKNEEEHEEDHEKDHEEDHEKDQLSFAALQQLVLLQERQIKSAEHKVNSCALANCKPSSARAVTVGWIEEQNKTLDRSAGRLQGVKQALAEVDNNAVVITTELTRNRHTLLGASQKTGQTHTELKGAGRILNRMFVRNVAQRAAIFGIIVAGAAVIVLTLVACLSTPPNPNLFNLATTGAPLSTDQH